MDSNLFAQYIECLSKEEDTFSITEQALGCLAEAYHFGRFVNSFSVPPTIYTREGEKILREFFFEGGEYDESVMFSKVYHTSEGGTLTLSVYSFRGRGGWTEQEKQELESIFDIYYFHSGRYRLAGMLRKGAMIEHLTGLPNVNGFTRQVAKLMEQGTISRYNAYYFNLKGFALINKHFSQQEGDEIICHYARIIQSFADGEECVGRLGGDNFVALLRREKNEEFLKLIGGVGIRGSLNGKEFEVTISAVAGVWEISDSIREAGETISRCAVALNLAKNVYKCPYLYASKELDDRVYFSKRIRSSFPRALADREIVVFYQPKVETAGYTITGAEALARWIRDGKIIPPCDFVPVIEENGMVCQLDFYMLEAVCRDMSRWKEKGIKPVRVSVNFSRKHLSNKNLVKDILEIVDRYGVEHSYIEIEVTETVNEEEHGQLLKFMHDIKEAQFYTAIDDFGTGYSSLNILRLLPVDVLKIDKSFIDGMVVTDKDKIILENIVHMAKELQVEVITEGVESWNQVDFLKEIHCNMVQGYLFDRPMPEDLFEEKLKTPRYEGH